ncbi:MAG: PD-(D/E)XK nuclease family protein [Polyangiaceae bacterium]
MSSPSMSWSRSVVLYPTERHVERARVARSGASAEEALTLRRFFARLRQELALERADATTALSLLVAKELVADGGFEDADVREPVSRAALGAAVDATLSELARAGTQPLDLERAGTARGKTLAAIARAHAARLEALEALDPRVPLLADALSTERAHAVALPRAVRVRATPDLARAELAALVTLHVAIRARGGSGVVIELLRFEAQDHPMSELGAELEAELSQLEDAPELEWLEPRAPSATSLVEAHGAEAEARAIARTVLEALAAGVAPDRIMIVAPPRDEALLAPLRAALREARVPFSEHGGPPARSSPEAALALGLLDMASSRIARERLVELLTTPGVHPGSIVGEPDETRALDLGARLAARLAELPLVQDRSGKLFAEVLREDQAARRRARERRFRARPMSPAHDDGWMLGAVERLGTLLDSLRDAPNLDATLAALDEQIVRLRLGEPSAGEVARALKIDRPETDRIGAASIAAMAEGAVAVRAVREAITALRDAAARRQIHERTTAAAEILHDLALLTDRVSTSARGGASRAAAVRIGPPREAAGQDLELCVVARMNDGAYTSSGSSLLDERTRRALPRARRPDTSQARTRAREAELAWAIASSSRVVLTSSSTDDDARDAAAQHRWFLDAVKSQSDSSPSQGSVRVERAPRASISASILSKRGAEIVALAAGAPPPPDLAHGVGVEARRLAFFMVPSAPPIPHAGLVDDRMTELLATRFGGLDASRAASVTAIERAAGCAFRAFAASVLRARKADELVDAVSPRERGILLHGALCAAFRRDLEQPPHASVEDRLAAARLAIEAEIGVATIASPIRREGRRRAADEAFEVFRADLDEPSPLSFREGERRFGPGEPPPWGPLTVTSVSGATYFIDGQIDRIDATRPIVTTVRIVDYKTGKAPREALSASDFQVPLYALVARRLEPQRILGVYKSIEHGGRVTTRPAKEAEQLLGPDLLRDVEARAAQVLARVHGGNVAPRPASSGLCVRCEMRDLCRRPAVAPDSDDDGEEA